ncbi:MauE/DoxX family redox-associated membrane protein [Thermodesulfobacteriota bacterium]
MSLLRNQYLLVLVRLLLGCLFVYAAIPKIADPFAFAVSVYNYKLLPGAGIGLVAAALPWLELVAGGCLIMGIRVRSAAVVITAMLGVFALALVVNTLRGIDVECGCFSTGRAIGWLAVAEDCALLLLGIWYVCCADAVCCLESAFRKAER